MSSSRRFVGVIVLALACCAPSVAAASWPLEVPGIVLVGYGETYNRAGDSATHWGLDIGCEAGARVLAPQGGRVTFSGWVPADGGRIRAVTIETDEGLLVTCSPLETADVVAGQTVGPLDVLGTLASTGDVSTPDSHLHVSARRGGAYLDPTAIVGASPGAESVPSQVADVTAPEVPDVQAPAAATQVQEMPCTDTSAPSDFGVLSGTPGTSVGTNPVHDPSGQSEETLPAVMEPNRVPVQRAVPGAIPGAATAQASLSPVAASKVAQSPQREISSAAIVGEAAVPLSSDRRAIAPSARAALLATAGILVGAIGLWPLWRPAVRPGFLNGVRPILDDVAAAVGR